MDNIISQILKAVPVPSERIPSDDEGYYEYPMDNICYLLVVSIQAWITNRWILKGIEYSRYFSVNSAFEGQEIEMIERISNRKLLPCALAENRI